MKFLSPIIAAASFAATTSAAAQAVPVCEALTLYGNAAASGLCKSLSPGNQNQKVCELSLNPDIHMTFNAGTRLHFTVRTPRCDRRSNLTGTWPNHLALAPNQPASICNVNVANYIHRLNAVPRLAAAPPNGLAVTAFNAAVQKRRLNQQAAQLYIDLAGQWNCP